MFAPNSDQVAKSIFKINFNLSTGCLFCSPFACISKLLRRQYYFVVDRTNIRIDMTRMVWSERNVRSRTGIGICFIRVHHPQMPGVTERDVTKWLMATFPERILAEQILVTQSEHVEILAQDSAPVENVFYPVLICYTKLLFNHE